MCNVLLLFIIYWTTLLVLRWDISKVRDRFGGMGRFKGGLTCKGCSTVYLHNKYNVRTDSFQRKYILAKAT